MPFNKGQLLAAYLLSDVLNLYFWIPPSIMEKRRGKVRENIYFTHIYFLPQGSSHFAGGILKDLLLLSKTTCLMRQSG